MWLFLKNVDDEDDVDMELRMIVATEGERVHDNNLEEKENFTKLFTSKKLEFLDKSEISVKVSGNLEAVCDLSTSTKLTFRPFVENRLTIPIKRKTIGIWLMWYGPIPLYYYLSYNKLKSLKVVKTKELVFMMMARKVWNDWF